MEGLTEGRIVHYVMPGGEHRPAIIVNVWETADCEGYANLQVFTDSNNDTFNKKAGVEDADIRKGIWWRTSICYSETKEVNTWHWIEPA